MHVRIGAWARVYTAAQAHVYKGAWMRVYIGAYVPISSSSSSRTHLQDTPTGHTFRIHLQGTPGRLHKKIQQRTRHRATEEMLGPMPQ